MFKGYSHFVNNPSGPKGQSQEQTCLEAARNALHKLDGWSGVVRIVVKDEQGKTAATLEAETDVLRRILWPI